MTTGCTPRETEWWRTFFSDVYADVWQAHQQLTGSRLPDEVVGIKRLLCLDHSAHILDLACGYGRYLYPLLVDGASIIGLDFSRDMLRRAFDTALDGSVPRLVQADMQRIPFGRSFDRVMILGGSFGYLDSDSKLAALLQEVSSVLEPHGLLLLDCVNRQKRLDEIVDEWSMKLDPAHELVVRSSFDRTTERYEEDLEVRGPRLHWKAKYQVRLFALQEICALAQSAHFRFKFACGDLLGASYDEVNSPRMIVVAERVAEK